MASHQEIKHNGYTIRLSNIFHDSYEIWHESTILYGKTGYFDNTDAERAAKDYIDNNSAYLESRKSLKLQNYE